MKESRTSREVKLSADCRPQDPAAHILHALHRLDSDYNHMKQQILAGVPLEHLYRPSAVSAAAHCVPVQVRLILPDPCKALNVSSRISAVMFVCSGHQ